MFRLRGMPPRYLLPWDTYLVFTQDHVAQFAGLQSAVTYAMNQAHMERTCIHIHHERHGEVGRVTWKAHTVQLEWSLNPEVQSLANALLGVIVAAFILGLAALLILIAAT